MWSTMSTEAVEYTDCISAEGQTQPPQMSVLHITLSSIR